MQAGRLRKRITFQTRSATKDSFGQQSVGWTDLITVWAEITGLSTREVLAAQAVQSEVTHLITTRYRPELALPRTVASLRVIYKTRIFNISGAINTDERNKEIVMHAAEGLNLG